METELPPETIETAFLPPCGWCNVYNSAYDMCEVHFAEQVVGGFTALHLCSLARQLVPDAQLLSYANFPTRSIPCSRLSAYLKSHQLQPEKD